MRSIRDILPFFLIMFFCLAVAWFVLAQPALNPAPAFAQKDAQKDAARDAAREIQERQEERYQQAIQYIRQEQYQEAYDLLMYLKKYKDGEVLYRYACAKMYYNRQDYNSQFAYSMLDEIPTNYKGLFADDIAAFRREAEPHREELMQLFYDEMDRQIAELKASEKPDSSGSGTRKSTGSRSGKKSSSKSSSSDNDPYNAKDYAHADDFYYDHWDDFIDFEDAENYYDEHN